jgi:hypothetical protein
MELCLEGRLLGLLGPSSTKKSSGRMKQSSQPIHGIDASPGVLRDQLGSVAQRDRAAHRIHIGEEDSDPE